MSPVCALFIRWMFVVSGKHLLFVVRFIRSVRRCVTATLRHNSSMEMSPIFWIRRIWPVHITAQLFVIESSGYRDNNRTLMRFIR